jgi:hypothetical protein
LPPAARGWFIVVSRGVFGGATGVRNGPAFVIRILLFATGMAAVKILGVDGVVREGAADGIAAVNTVVPGAAVVAFLLLGRAVD